MLEVNIFSSILWVNKLSYRPQASINYRCRGLMDHSRSTCRGGSWQQDDGVWDTILRIQENNSYICLCKNYDGIQSTLVRVRWENRHQFNISLPTFYSRYIYTKISTKAKYNWKYVCKINKALWNFSPVHKLSFFITRLYSNTSFVKVKIRYKSSLILLPFVQYFFG